jgi:DNA-(apurinic or apyrimidinic site) lyase
VKNPSKKAAPKNAPIKSEQSSLRFQASDELPHNLGSLSDALATDKAPAGSPDDSDKENRNLTAQNISNRPVDPENANADVPTASFEQREEAGDSTATPAKKPRQTRVSYGLTAGKTPYPDWGQPNAAECEEVNRLLSEIHGQVTAPKKIPEPSLTVTGCGEVPSVLDALIRTLLSGATSGTNSALAFDGLVKRFGILSEGIGKGSVNWDAVRRASLEDVFKAIKRGGLAAIKSKNLKAILDQIYDENQERVKELDMDPSADKINPTVSPGKMENEKEYRTACADQHFLSLDHIHKLSTPEAMAALVKYPGIGPKTAACVCLFCLQRPCFAVDTHIFRITKWLGWVPDNANEVTSFSHLEVRIPDHLKYSLHQLFIKHGKTCPRCRAITGEKSVGWEQGCAIEHLVKRTGARKGGPPLGKKKAPQGVKRKKKAPRGVKRKNKSKKTAASPSTAKTKQRKASTRVTPQSSARRNPPRNASAKVQVVIESTPSDLEESSTPAPPTTVESSIVKIAPATLSPDEVASSSSPSTPTPKEKDRRGPTSLKPRAPRKAQIEKAAGKSKGKKNARATKAKVRGRKTGS